MEVSENTTLMILLKKFGMKLNDQLYSRIVMWAKRENKDASKLMISFAVCCGFHQRDFILVSKHCSIIYSISGSNVSSLEILLKTLPTKAHAQLEGDCTVSIYELSRLPNSAYILRLGHHGCFNVAVILFGTVSRHC